MTKSKKEYHPKGAAAGELGRRRAPGRVPGASSSLRALVVRDSPSLSPGARSSLHPAATRSFAS
eukprot:240961-Hanusia_phi.AAC.1